MPLNGKFGTRARTALASSSSESCDKHPSILTLFSKAIVELYHNLFDRYRSDATFKEASDCAIHEAIEAHNAGDVNKWRDDFQSKGYVKIWSNRLGMLIYFAKNKEIADTIADTSHPKFTVKDMESLRGVSDPEFRIVALGKASFGGEIVNDNERQANKGVSSNRTNYKPFRRVKNRRPSKLRSIRRRI